MADLWILVGYHYTRKALSEMPKIVILGAHIYQSFCPSFIHLEGLVGKRPCNGKRQSPNTGTPHISPMTTAPQLLNYFNRSSIINCKI